MIKNVLKHVQDKISFFNFMVDLKEHFFYIILVFFLSEVFFDTCKVFLDDFERIEITLESEKDESNSGEERTKIIQDDEGSVGRVTIEKKINKSNFIKNSIYYEVVFLSVPTPPPIFL